MGWSAELDGTPATDLGVSYTAPIIIAFVAFTVAATRRRATGVLFIGCVSTISLIPSIPHLPFIRELGHLAIWGLIVFYLKDVMEKGGPGYKLTFHLNKMDLSLILLGAFIVTGILSIAVNFAMTNSIFFLKIGISEVAVYLSLFGFLFIVTADQEVRRAGYRLIMDALLIAAFVAIGLGVVGLFALSLSEVQPHNDTALGFGYHCRLKASFFGPVHAGIFYTASIPVLLHHASTTTSRRLLTVLLIALVVDAVLIIATGSRAARLATIVMLAGGLLYRPYRRTCLYIIPFYALVFYFGFFYRCIEAATAPLLGDADPTYQNIQGVFFEDSIRGNLIMDSLGRWLMVGSDGMSPATTGEQIVRVLLGIGPGIAGIASTGYEPHLTILDILLEQGVIGLALALSAVLYVVYRLLAGFRRVSGAFRSACVAALMALAAIFAGGLVFATQSWVFVWCFLALGFVLARDVETFAGGGGEGP